MFTGKYPPSHGARYDPKGPLFLSHGIDDDGEFREYRARGLAQDEVTLAALLQADDYATGAVVAGPWMKRIFGLDAGFDHYDDSLVTQLAGGLAADVTDAALDWVRAHADERQFLFLNYYDPHSPYGPPTAFRFFSGPRLWFTPGTPEAEARFLYDAEVEYLDRHLGRFFEGLRDLALYEDALIIVTADHGELLGEQGHFGHGKLLTEAELHVPLIVKFPSNANAGGRHEARVSNTGLFAMVLEQVGLEAPATAQADLRGETRAPIIAEVNPLAVVADTGASRALYAGRFKLLWNVGTGATLHDLEADPSGTVDFSPSFPDVAREMRRALDDFYANAPKPGEAGPARQVDEETMRALESLGYLEDGAQGGSP